MIVISFTNFCEGLFIFFDRAEGKWRDRECPLRSKERKETEKGIEKEREKKRVYQGGD
jgi:hypothetical protein